MIAAPVAIAAMQIDTKTVIWASAIAEILLLVQIPGLMVLLSQLLKGPFRRPPLKPVPSRPTHHGAVSVIVPTLNEVHRLAPCLEGLITQGREVREILVVDSHSTDGTRAQVQAYQTREPRLKLLSDPPLPAGWVGRPWALHYGFQQSSPESTWILGIDADTYPQPGLVAALLQAMLTEGFDLVSLAPQFILKTPGELWLQPALLMTLVYRFGPAGGRGGTAARVMANGQCFMARRALLERLEGYTSARASFCDDVTLARRAAQQAKVGFWDGSQVLKVQMYDGLGETWREWGRSLDLKDATSPAQVWWDCLFLLGVQGWPWVIGPLLAGTFWRAGGPQTPVLQLCLGVNLTLMLIRISMQFAIRPSYDLSMARSTWAFWLSPLADPLAVVRIALSSLTVPTQWRGRHYSRRQFR